MYRLKAAFLFLAVCALSLHAHAKSDPVSEDTKSQKSDSTSTQEPTKLATFGMFTLRAVKKEESVGDSKLRISED